MMSSNITITGSKRSLFLAKSARAWKMASYHAWRGQPSPRSLLCRPFSHVLEMIFCPLFRAWWNFTFVFTHLFEYSCPVDSVTNEINGLQHVDAERLENSVLYDVRVVQIQICEHGLRQGVSFQPRNLKMKPKQWRKRHAAEKRKQCDMHIWIKYKVKVVLFRLLIPVEGRAQYFWVTHRGCHNEDCYPRDEKRTAYWSTYQTRQSVIYDSNQFVKRKTLNFHDSCLERNCMTVCGFLQNLCENTDSVACGQFKKILLVQLKVEPTPMSYKINDKQVQRNAFSGKISKPQLIAQSSELCASLDCTSFRHPSLDPSFLSLTSPQTIQSCRQKCTSWVNGLRFCAQQPFDHLLKIGVNIISQSPARRKTHLESCINSPRFRSEQAERKSFVMSVQL